MLWAGLAIATVLGSVEPEPAKVDGGSVASDTVTDGARAPEAHEIGAHWSLRMGVGGGVLLETSGVARDRNYAFSTHAPAPSTALAIAFTRTFGSGLVVGGSLRAGLIGPVDYALGLTGGYERAVSRTLSLHGLATLGYAGYCGDAYECTGMKFDGPWGRLELGGRHYVIAATMPGARPRALGFDVFVEVAAGVSAMRAAYPTLDQYGLALDHHGLRVGPDGTIGAGFVF